MPLQATSGAASYDAFGGGVAAVPQYIEDVFSTYLYTGNGSTQTITNGIDLSTKGGLVWGKSRSVAADNVLVDSARGIANTLVSNSTGAQNAIATAAIGSFNSNGFSFSGNSDLNANPNTYASWTFRKQPKFFDVVTYTGNGVDNRAIPHSLGSVPGCMILKATVSTVNLNSWAVYHRSLPTPPDSYLILNATNAYQTYSGFWGTTGPDANNFYIDAAFNESGKTYVVYLYAHDAGGFGLSGTDNVISCGSIELDGSSYSTVNLGYEPQWVLTKNATSTSSGGWEICDNMRGMPATSGENYLLANSSAAEGTGGYNLVRPTSTGFSANSSAGTYIYIAIRRGPMKVPTDGTKVFSPTTYTGTGAARSVTGLGFPPDMVMLDSKSFANNFTYDKLRGPNIRLFTNDTAAETNDANRLTSFDQNGYSLGNLNPNESGVGYANWNFRRAPSFFDEVCYTGNGTSGATQAHNLTVTPELMIIKSRSNAENWGVWCSYTPTKEIYLNLAGSYGSGNDATASATTITLQGMGGTSAINASGSTYVAYLFASCAGVSKVGSYTGTGTTLQVDCGFTGGARFVLIKRTDSTGAWYVWDSARGIVAGDDPYLLLNSTAAEVTNTDYVDTYSAGFEISSTAPAAINASGGTYIFLAIA